MGNPQQDNLLRRRSVTARTGLSSSSLSRAVRARSFPLPVVLTERTVAWRESEVDAWIASRPTIKVESAR